MSRNCNSKTTGAGAAYGKSWRKTLLHWPGRCEHGKSCRGHRHDVHACGASATCSTSNAGTANNTCPHVYLAPLLTDECRSTVGPQGWEPQNCVFTCVSWQEREAQVCLQELQHVLPGEWSSSDGRLRRQLEDKLGVHEKGN